MEIKNNILNSLRSKQGSQLISFFQDRLDITINSESIHFGLKSLKECW